MLLARYSLRLYRIRFCVEQFVLIVNEPSNANTVRSRIVPCQTEKHFPSSNTVLIVRYGFTLLYKKNGQTVCSINGGVQYGEEFGRKWWKIVRYNNYTVRNYCNYTRIRKSIRKCNFQAKIIIYRVGTDRWNLVNWRKNTFYLLGITTYIYVILRKFTWNYLI